MTQKKFNRKMGSIFTVAILISSGLLIILPLNFSILINGSTWTQTTDKDFDNGTLDNLTTIGIKEDAKLRIDLSDIKTWTHKKPKNTPGFSYRNSMASVYGTDNVVIYGGYPMANETWVYDFSDNTWLRKTPIGGPQERRDFAVMASIYGDDKVLFFGGQMNQNHFNETWIYDLSENKWTNYLASNAPFSRIHHGMATIFNDDKVLLFGGTYWDSGWRMNNETWVYDLSDNRWTMMTNSGPKPGYIYAIASFSNDDKVILFGGASGDGDETWIYDLSDKKWIQKFPVNRPTTRLAHALETICGTDQVMLFGGYYGINNFHNDTWVYDLSDDNWYQKKPKNSPSARYGSDTAPIYGTDHVLLYGGINRINETWIYRNYLPPRNGTITSTPYDTGANSSFRTISWQGNIPLNTSIKFQLRTASNESNLAAKDFIGPDGTTATFYNSPPASIWSGHYGDRWVQYKGYLNISIFTQSPSLDDVKISYNCLPNTIVIGPVDGSSLSDNKPSFVWTFNDFDSTLQKGFQVLIDDDINFTNVDYNSGEQVNSEQSWEFPTGTNYTELPDGSWYWKVRTMDSDGDWSEFSEPRKLIIDTQAPYSAPNLPINDGYYNSLDILTGFADDGLNGSGISKVEVAVKRLRDNYHWNGTAWISLKTWLLAHGAAHWSYDSNEIPWLSGTKYCIQSRAIDNTSNIEHPDSGNIFTIDLNRPVSTIDNPKHDIWVNRLTTISGESIDLGGAGTDKVEISIKCVRDKVSGDGDAKESYFWDGIIWTPDEAWLTAIGTNQWFYNISTIPWTTGDHYLIHSRATDKSTNIELPGPGKKFMYDAQPPEGLSIYINNGEEFTSSGKLKLSLQAEDVDSGISQMAFSTDDEFWYDWELFNVTSSYELPKDDLVNDGEKTVYYKARDYAGNIAESIFDSIILDTTPPYIASIVINDNAKYTSNESVELTLEAMDSLSGIAEMSFSTDGLEWSSWEPFGRKRPYTLPSPDGEKIVYFKVMDNVGNIAQAKDFIILDSTPPHSLSILINAGVAEINSTIVQLILHAIDNLSGVHQMSFSTDGETWSTWETYSEVKTFELSAGDGRKNIFFKVKDQTGNTAKPVLGSVFLNTKPKGEEIPKEDSQSNLWLWIILILIIILLLILIVLMVIKKRKESIEQKILSSGARVVKPTELSGSIVTHDQIPGIPAASPLASTGVASDAPQPIPPVISQEVPKLVKSTQMTQEPPPRQTPQVPELSALPPAKIQEPEQKTEALASVSTGTANATQTVAVTPVQTNNTQPPTPTIVETQNPKQIQTVQNIGTIPNQSQPVPTQTKPSKNEDINQYKEIEDE